MPLSFVELGEVKVIQEFRGKEDVKRHLQDIGFIKGEEVKVLSENKSGLIILVKGVRVAVNKSLASKIMVA
ncbi:MAG: ferrous iron transport protein A [Lachnospiraceae bacterium]|nr:ferrous iron transport protein A [Lachnospiraceae bacterium]